MIFQSKKPLSCHLTAIKKPQLYLEIFIFPPEDVGLSSGVLGNDAFLFTAFFFFLYFKLSAFILNLLVAQECWCCLQCNYLFCLEAEDLIFQS